MRQQPAFCAGWLLTYALLSADPPNAFYNELNPEHEAWRHTTALEISHRRDPPMRVKMLVRDFIDDSLYNVRIPAVGSAGGLNVSLTNSKASSCWAADLRLLLESQPEHLHHRN